MFYHQGGHGEQSESDCLESEIPPRFVQDKVFERRQKVPGEGHDSEESRVDVEIR